MRTLIDHLRSFNRKERFILLREALGEATFRLDEDFRRRLGGLLGVSIPADAFVAMDYHFDWLQMALYLADNPSPAMPIPNDGLVRGNQEDTDLLVAFENGRTTHLVLVEAKVEIGWTNKQLRSKAERLASIFEQGRLGADLATPHFVLVSPSESAGIKTDSWPDWMTSRGKPIWMKLPRPHGLRKVTRCTAEEVRSARGHYLRIDP